MILKLFVVLLGTTAISSLKSYHNYKVIDVTPTTDDQLKVLSDLQNSGYDFWTDITKVGMNIRILVSPNKSDDFMKLIKDNGMSGDITIQNVQKLIDDQLRPARFRQRYTHASFSWDRYYNLEKIYAYMDELKVMYPDHVNIVTVGSGTQGNLIKSAIIDLKKGNRINEPYVAIVEGGIHAREWIAPATVTWIMKEFFTNSDPEVRGLAENFVWHFIPVANPDGYNYTFTNDRMWRKNRNPAYEKVCTPETGDSSSSIGVDLNRNFDFKWMTTGASNDSCSNTFAGSYARSEPETQAITSYVSVNTNNNLMYYIAFHSYSQLILVPYSHSTAQNVLESGNYADMFEIGIRGADKLKERYGTEYSVGLSADLMYTMSGTSYDTFKADNNATLAYLFELRDKGDYGFLLPPSEIVESNLEIMDALLEMDKTARMLGYYEREPSSS